MDDSRGSGLGPIRGAPNVDTMLRASGGQPRIDDLGAREAWSALVPGLALVPPRDPSVAAYRLFWTGRGENGFRDCPLDAGAHLIIGRHAACDVVLGGDGEISLRHVIVLPARGADGAPAVRLVDLLGSMPMFLDDDSAHRSLLAEGPFVVRLGRYVLGGFPIGAGSEAPPHDLPRATRVDGSRPAPIAAAQERPGPPSIGGPYRAAERRARSVITMMPRPITMIESVGSAAEPDAIGLLGAARAGERVRISVSAEALRAGVLVGRADKCTDRGLKPLLTIRVSRVHAVVIDQGGRTMLYDCASTNGTFASGRMVRSVELRADAPVVQLAGHDGVELRWTPLRAR